MTWWNFSAQRTRLPKQTTQKSYRSRYRGLFAPGLRGLFLLRPKRPVQRSVLDCFSNVSWLNHITGRQICNRPSDLQNAIVCPRAEALLDHGALQQVLRIRTELAVFANLARAHLGVAVDSLAAGVKPQQLDISRPDHTLANVGRALGHGSAAQLAVIHRGHIDVDVDAIHQRPGNLRHIALNHHGRATTLTHPVIVIAAGIGVTSLLNKP